jgi:hypothetical protein
MYKHYPIRLTLVLAASLLAACGVENSTNTPPDPSETMETNVISTEPQITETTAPANTWIRRFGGSQQENVFDLQLVDNGGFLIAGGTNIDFETEMQGDMYLMQVDENGEPVWEETIQNEESSIAQNITPTEGGGLLISGIVYTENNGQDTFVTQLDQDRNELWTWTVGGPLDELGSALPIDDGGYYLAGSIVDPNDFVVDPGVAGYAGLAGRSNIFLTRVDAGGNVVWSRTFGGNNNVIVSSFLSTPDGGVIILAYILGFPELDDDIYLLKVDADGNEVWSQTWEEGNLDGYDLISTLDGNYLIVGTSSPASDENSADTDILFIKVDQEGNQIWQSIFGDPNMFDGGYSVTESLSGGFVAIGDWESDNFNWNGDISVVRIDENGQLVWRRIIEMNTHTMLIEILSCPEGGYVITGSTYHGNNFDIVLIRTDEEGNVQE